MRVSISITTILDPLSNHFYISKRSSARLRDLSKVTQEMMPLCEPSISETASTLTLSKTTTRGQVHLHPYLQHPSTQTLPPESRYFCVHSHPITQTQHATSPRKHSCSVHSTGTLSHAGASTYLSLDFYFLLLTLQSLPKIHWQLPW